MLDFLRSIPHQFKPEEVKLIEHAVEYATKAHGEQKRKSGEPFISHPLAASVILGQVFPDAQTIAATILHDLTEDTAVTQAELVKEFGPAIGHLVDGVTKLGKVRLRNSKDHYFLENLRKMFLATSQDLRVILIKLADRLHNMRTIEHLSEEKQKKIANETLEMYAPIAGRLGIGVWKDELEDRSFQIVDPDNYNRTMALLHEAMVARDTSAKLMEKELASTFRQEGLKFVEISGRVKRAYSLFKKLQKYDGDASKIYDILALRIITKSTADCYAVLGIIHKHFQPLPGRVKDFIATPKPNGYQSLHTTVFDKHGHAFEIQIRTDLMHEAAERGVAAHWFYEEGGKSDTVERGAAWFKELHTWQEASINNPDEFIESLKIDFFRDRIFVLTPKGDVRDLPTGASCIDFAFAVHGDLGYHMMGAKINGKIARLADELHQGDMVEILKSKKPVTISQDWLKSAKTSHARSQIRKYLKEHNSGLVARIKELSFPNLPKFFRRG